MIPADDRGFTLGDGLFETVLWQDGEPVFWPAHMDRLLAGCDVLGLPRPDPALLLTEARRKAAGLGRAAVRITWSAGSGGRGLDRPRQMSPRLVVSAAAASAPTTPARLVTSAVRRNESSPTSRLKTLSYLDNVLARREALAAGADEAVMLNTRGDVACATAANLFWRQDGRLFTPMLDCGVLDGIMRGNLVAALDVEEVRAGPDALAAADAIFLTNSLIGVRMAAELDGRSLAADPDLYVQVAQVIWLERRGRR